MPKAFEIRPVKGTLIIERKFLKLDARFKRGIRKGARKSGVTVRDRVRYILNNGTRTGIHYANLPNRSSAPGEPPRTQSGRLAQSAGYRVRGTTEFSVFENAKYADKLEKGIRIEPRPHLITAINKESGVVETYLREEVYKEIKNLMLSPEAIIAQLQENLPKFTDKFYNAVPIISASSVSNVLTITLSAGHGIIAGQQILINNALIRNKIDSVSLTVDNTLLFQTLEDHDLTAFMENRPGRQWPEGATVTIEGLQEYELDANENGVQPPKGFETKPGYPLPVLGGSEYLLENRSLGAKGFQIVDSVTPTTLTITLSGVPSIPDGDLIISDIITNIRVAMVPDIERAEKMYSGQDSEAYWLFLIMGDREVSRDRANEDDFESLPASSFKILNIIENFSTVIFAPTNNELGATQVQSDIYTNIFQILLKCLYGWEEVGYTGDGASRYNTAFYAHSFDWQTRDQIDYENGWENTNTVAFRILDFSQEVLEYGESSGNINL